MSIYPDKKNGNFTGRWRVEVQRNNRTLKARVDTREEAILREQELLHVLRLPEGVPSPFVQDRQGGAFSTRWGTKGRTIPTTLLEALEQAGEALWTAEEHRETQASSARAIAALIGPQVRLRDLRTEDFDEAVAKLRASGLKDNTINRKVSAVRCVLKWALKRQYIRAMPDLPFFKEPEGRVRWLTPEEENRLVTLLRSYGVAGNLVADFVIVAVDTGLRRGELLGLDPDQVQDGWIHLWGDRTKTKRSRSVPLSPRAELTLLARLDDTPRPLFRGLLEHTLRWYWDRAKADMGLAADAGFVVHALRHTCATRLVNDGVDVFTVQKWLGHRVLETTRRYAHINDASLLRARDAMFGRRGARVGENVSPAPSNENAEGTEAGVSPSGQDRANPL